MNYCFVMYVSEWEASTCQNMLKWNYYVDRVGFEVDVDTDGRMDERSGYRYVFNELGLISRTKEERQRDEETHILRGDWSPPPTLIIFSRSLDL